MPQEGTHPELNQARRELDRALLALCSLDEGELSLHELELELAEGLRQVYLALGAAGDAEAFAAAREHAVQRVAAGLARLQSADAAERDALAVCSEPARSALQRLQSARYKAGTTPLQLPPSPDAGTEWIHASMDLPELLNPPRPTLRPTLVLQETEPRVEPLELDAQATVTAPGDLHTLSALLQQSQAQALTLSQPDAAPDADARPDADAGGPGLDEEALEALRFGSRQAQSAIGFERARLALDEMGMLFAMRRPDDEDAWSSNRRCEQRILCRLDAIVAAGPEHLPALIKLLEERPITDPELSLALLFSLGCLAGDDSLDQVERLLQLAELEEEDLRQAAADALSFAPHPGIAPMLLGWLADARPERRALSVEVLGRRRRLSADQLAAASRDDALWVQRAAALALDKQLGPVPSAAIHLLIHHEDAQVAQLALHAAARRRDPRALQRAEALCREGRPQHGDAALVCALSGGRSSLNALEGQSDACVLEAMGWAGEAQSLEPLLRTLESGDDAERQAAALALHRISGLQVSDPQQQAQSEAPQPLPSDDAPFQEGYREPLRARDLSLDASPWREQLEPSLQRLDTNTRYRHGRPFLAAHDLWEITDAGALRCDRRHAHLELCARFGLGESLDTEQFVAHQRQQHSRIQAQLSGASALPGPWHSLLQPAGGR